NVTSSRILKTHVSSSGCSHDVANAGVISSPTRRTSVSKISRRAMSAGSSTVVVALSGSRSVIGWAKQARSAFSACFASPPLTPHEARKALAAPIPAMLKNCRRLTVTSLIMFVSSPWLAASRESLSFLESEIDEHGHLGAGRRGPAYRRVEPQPAAELTRRPRRDPRRDDGVDSLVDVTPVQAVRRHLNPEVEDRK